MPSSPSERSLGIIINLAHLLHLSIDKNSVSKSLFNHPEYPSILALSETLRNFGIENEGLKFEYTNRWTLDEQPMPLLCVLDAEVSEGICVIVINIQDDLVEYLDPVKGYFLEPYGVFLEKWWGHALVMDPLLTDKLKSGKNSNMSASVRKKIAQSIQSIFRRNAGLNNP